MAKVWQQGWSAGAPPQIIDPASTVFSPLTQIRRSVPLDGQSEESKLPYLVNSLGLIDNEGASPSLDAMPEKPAGMIRIILYGGSTAMGIGARDGTETISAQLERLLNRNANQGTVFQVLNFGHGACQSYTDLRFMVSMGNYLEPDVSILLNGFNDAFFATESAAETAGLPYVINWANYSYYFNNVVNGLVPPPRVSVPFLPFSSLLVGVLTRDDRGSPDAIQRAYNSMPIRSVTKWFESRHGRDFLLAQNLQFTAGYFVPSPGDVAELPTTPAPPIPEPADDSTTGISTRSGNRRHVDPPRPAARTRRVPATDDRDVHRVRRAIQGPCPRMHQFANIRFHDIRDIFDSFEKPAYQDIIHYTPAAQHRLAERMFTDLQTVDAVRRHLRTP